MRGLSRHPSGPLPPVDVLEAGRVDAHRLLRPPPLAASHHHGLLTPPLAAATAARDTAVPPARSRRDRSAPPPWLASRAATAEPSRSRWWARAVAGAGVSSRGASKNCRSSGRRPTAAATRLRPCTAC